MLRNRSKLEGIESKELAEFAQKSFESRGREHSEMEPEYRLCYQRDIDRIVHSRAFRRLEYKTQVFVNYEGDHYRTRLTHTFEVAQVAESMARSLGLNEDLTRAIGLAHDLGHTPFGHAGEEVLNELTEHIGGFEHNRQSLRLVEKLEALYPHFHGLNLTWEVREGLLKHCSIYDTPQVDRFEPDKHPTLEAQVVNLADELAYTCHDLEDGLRSGLIEPDQLSGVELWNIIYESAGGDRLPFDLLKYQAVRQLKDLLVKDALTHSAELIESAGVRSVDDVRNASTLLIMFSPQISSLSKELSQFLLDRFYFHHRVVRMTTKAKWFLRDLFKRYMDTPRLLPEKIQHQMNGKTPERVICDYIAGMTDRFALDEYAKLVDPNTRV